MNPYPKEKAEVIAQDDALVVRESVNLLDDIYNGTTTLKLIESATKYCKKSMGSRNFYWTITTTWQPRKKRNI